MYCLDCPLPTRSVPGALYCPDCHAVHLNRVRNPTPADIARGRNDDRAWTKAGLPPRPWPVAASDWTTGKPNVTCPACQGRYHYGAPALFTHLCPLCGVWLCWQETDETKDEVRWVGKACPVCGKVLQDRSGPYGPWWGCTYIRKGHKDNCAGKRKWGDCDVVVEQRPRMGLAVWVAYMPGVMDRKAEEMAELAERVEGREAWVRKVRGVRWKKGIDSVRDL